MPPHFNAKSATSCPHFDTGSNSIALQKWFQKVTQVKFQRLLNSLQSSSKSAVLEKLDFKECELKCFKCKKIEAEISGPLYCCMSCDISGCWQNDFHLKAHLNEAHPLGVELSSGTIYCGLCNVFIWNSSMELFSRCPQAMATARPLLGAKSSQKGSKSQSNSPTKGKRKASLNEEALESSQPSEIVGNHCHSMRGLVNMGNTCFMASVLQVLLHCDKLRDFFVSASHVPKGCNRKGSSQKSSTSQSVCMACELDTLFQKNYCGELSPFAPSQFLASMWRSSKNLSGYEQQDAHEFMISLLNQLHTDLGGSHFACKCPVHTSFTGVLQSDVTCLSCGTVNASFDPFIDVSLDIMTPGNEALGFVDPTTTSLSLHECFQMFTHAEKLSSNTYMCANCNHTYQEATKQLSIRKAPETLTIHLKRFEHSLNTVKIDTFLQFPLQFSIFDYTTEGVHLHNEVNRISASGNGFSSMTQSILSPTVIDPAYAFKKYSKEHLYRLIATVNHTGVVDSGHYVSFVTTPGDSGAWFKFDDALVTKVPSATVLHSNPYMLFYQRMGDSVGDPFSDDSLTVE